MLIDMLSSVLERSGALERAWSKLDQGQDATIGVASSARPFLVAARFARDPRTTLVVCAGEEGADTFARTVGAYVGEEKVYRLRDYDGNPFSVDAPAQPKLHGERLEALWALQTARPVIVVASARSLLRRIAPAALRLAEPIELSVGLDLSEADHLQAKSFEDFESLLVSMGYENTGELDGPGTFCVQGGAIDVYPGNMSYPVRLDFFGDEVDEIRRFLPSTGQTISSLPRVSIFPVSSLPRDRKARARAVRALGRRAETNSGIRALMEALEDDSRAIPDVMEAYLLEKSAQVSDYLPAGALTVLIEPRSLIDDGLHAIDELAKKAQGTSVAVEDLYCSASELDFGSNARATYVSIMRVGVEIDSELTVKRTEVAGDPERLYGRLSSLSRRGSPWRSPCLIFACARR